VLQPSTHLAVAGPEVGGGTSGNAGGVGDVRGLAVTDGNEGCSVGDALFGKSGSGERSQAASITRARTIEALFIG
jgi:hypothetical protein